MNVNRERKEAMVQEISDNFSAYESFYLLDFMACSETVKEIKEWNSCVNCGAMADNCQVLYFLD